MEKKAGCATMAAMAFAVLLQLVSSSASTMGLLDVEAYQSLSEIFLEELHPCGRFCLCNDTFASCVEHHSNLTYIPKLLEHITELNFSSNSLENITKITFRNISMSHIKKLWLRYNGIKHITKDAFNVFHDIDLLDLSNNPISLTDLSLAFNGLRNINLQWLDLGNISLSNFNHSIMKGIRKTENIILRLNLITIVDFARWYDFKNLDMLDLSYNKISKIVNVSLIDLNVLKARSNYLVSISNLCKENIKSSLEDLDLSHNLLVSVTSDDLKCFTSLKSLLLIGNSFREIKSNTFSCLPYLRKLYLDDAFSSSPHVEEYAFNNSALNEIHMNTIRYVFKPSIDENAFKGCTNLTEIYLAYNLMFSVDNGYLMTLWGDLITVKVLNLFHCELNFFPVVIADRLLNLEHLKLYWNDIRVLRKGIFDKMQNLKWISLGRNGIVDIDSDVFPINLRNQLTYVNFADNPLTCTCNALWLIEWMKRESHKFGGYPNYYKCGDSKNPEATLMINARLTDLICSTSKMFPVIISVSGITFILIVITSVVYRWRWHIRHYIYMLRYRRRNQHLNDVDKVFAYDAFVLFCDDDFRWVRERLMPKIEEDARLRLCIHQRDFTPGEYIVDNILDSLDTSRKVVMVLSNDFSKSQWCEFELAVVQKRALELQDGYLVVILLEDLEARKMTSSLYALLETTTYIMWPEDQEDRELFWERVKASIEH